jgi:DNA (cytosine-5)-methyltransferase 1
MQAEQFGVPQIRKRVFIVGFRDRLDHDRFIPPAPTHSVNPVLDGSISTCITVREALGLPDIGVDGIAPTLRSGFTGPRSCTGVVNSKASMDAWGRMEVWPNGVQSDRTKASLFPPENGHFRMSVQDCALLQGFPSDWEFKGAVYQQLGQIGNSVAPPVAYQVARSILRALEDDNGRSGR